MGESFTTWYSPVCVRTYSSVARPSYEGTNISVGMTLAMGWDRFFVAVPITYAWTDVDIINETVTALNITPRIGMTGDMGERGTVAAFLGATYLRAEVNITGEIGFETPDGPEGDFTPEEVETLVAAGARPVGLGPLRLRVETAAVAIMSCVSMTHPRTQPPGC